MRTTAAVLALGLILAACGDKKTEPAADAPKADPAAEKAPAAEGAAPAEEAAEGAAPAAEKAAAEKAPAEAPTPVAPKGTVPALLGDLSAEHTIAAGGMEGLDALARRAGGVVENLPPELKKDMPPGGLDAAAAAMGFDPRTAEGWAAAGVDPTAGVAVVLDARLVSKEGEPWPLVLARVTDRAKLVATLQKADAKFELGLPEADGIAKLKGPEGTAFLGTRGKATALMPAPDGEQAAAARAAFAAWLKGGEPPLSGVEALAPSLRMAGTDRIWGITFSGGLVKLVGEEVPAVFADYYTQRFPAIAGAVSGDMKDGGMRIQGDAAAVAALRQVFVPAAAAPKMGGYGYPGGIMVGFSLNLAQLFDGVVALVPDERADLRGQVLIGKNAVPMGIGVSLDDLAKAFTGHFAVMFDTKGMMQTGPEQNLVFVAGVGDQAVADKALAALLDRVAGGAPGSPPPPDARKPTKFFEHEGHIVTPPGGQPVFAVRFLDVVLVAPSRKAIEVAIGRSGKWMDAPQLDFGNGTFYSTVVPTAALDAVAKAADDPEAEAALKVARDFWAGKVGDRFTMRWAIDDHGIVSPGAGGAASMGVLTAVAIPAFLKYIKKSKEAEARVTLARLSSAALMAKLEEKTLAAAPLTPGKDPCADDDEGRYTITPETFAHPTWKALGFAPTGTQYFRYAFEPADDGGFVVRAVGDLDCDGVFSTYESRGRADGTIEPNLTVINELE